jgi:hypothetical protein
LAVAGLAEVAVRARTHVGRAGYNKEIIYVPEPESSTRLAQQLAQLAKGSALIGGRTEVNDEDMTLVRRVAFDCIPPTRKQIIEALITGLPLASLKMPGSTLSYAKEDLEAQGILEWLESKERPRLTNLARECLGMAGIRPAEPEPEPPAYRPPAARTAKGGSRSSSWMTLRNFTRSTPHPYICPLFKHEGGGDF